MVIRPSLNQLTVILRWTGEWPNTRAILCRGTAMGAFIHLLRTLMFKQGILSQTLPFMNPSALLPPHSRKAHSRLPATLPPKHIKVLAGLFRILTPRTHPVTLISWLMFVTAGLP